MQINTYTDKKVRYISIYVMIIYVLIQSKSYYNNLGIRRVLIYFTVNLMI